MHLAFYVCFRYDIEPDFVEVANQDENQDVSEEDLNRGLLLSRFGVWILASQCRTVSLCKSDERLGYLISVVFDWMTATASISDKGVRAKIETLKKEYISNWINVVKKANLDLYCTCLLPDPPTYVQMQGTSDMLADKIRLLKEGLYRICCLIPYNLVPQEVSYQELRGGPPDGARRGMWSSRQNLNWIGREKTNIHSEFNEACPLLVKTFDQSTFKREKHNGV
jgi:hypothetical protein